MPLRRRLELVDETVAELELAADRCYYDARELLVAGRSAAGVYLMGYVAEMLLKNAYALFGGARPTDFVGSWFGPARLAAQDLIPGVQHESYHSLRFWALLLVATRRRAGRLLDDVVEAAFHQCTRRLYQNWWVIMRYRNDRTENREVNSVLDDVDWLRAHYVSLWR